MNIQLLLHARIYGMNIQLLYSYYYTHARIYGVNIQLLLHAMNMSCQDIWHEYTVYITCQDIWHEYTHARIYGRNIQYISHARII